MRKTLLLLMGLLLIYANAYAAPAPLTLPGHSKSNSIKIRLNSHHFDPLMNIPADHISNKISRMKKQKTGDSVRPEYYIVQFDAPIQKSWKKALQAAGAKIFDYVPDFAFIIRLTAEREQKIRSLPHVRWLGKYQPSFKLSRKLADPAFANSKKDKRIILQLSLFPDEDIMAIRTGVSSLGGIIEKETTTKWKTKLKLSIPADMINELSTLTGIKKVEPEPKWKLYNNIAADIMTVTTSRDTHGLYGLGQTVGICDTGLDQGTVIPSGLHDDFEDGDGTSRVIQIFDVAGDSDTSDVNSGHGTHVSGSVLGNGINSGSNPLLNSFPDTSFSGIAPKANLILQASEDNLGGYLNLPIDLNILFEEADNAGADLHTNSWGEPVASAYNSSSEEVDQYIWDNKDFLIFFAAGNDGIDSDSDGVIDLYSIGAPATAKNCLTIGATENLRSSGGYDFQWATGSWAPDYPVNPISSDLISDDAYGMAAFSSRGPTLDGRYKPDLVAPGTNIVSVRSSMAALTGWGIYDDNYLYMGGTSMSTPLAAGTAALLREYLITVKGFVTPSAALLKAALLNSAEDISPGQYGIGLFQEIPSSPVPNNVEGWGRINFENSVYPEGSFGINYFDEQTGLSTGNYNEYTVDVYDSSRPLKVNLVWTDYPGSSSVQGGLVNDLDLQITTPSQEVLYPDNAILPSVASDLSYYDLSPEYYTSADVAVKLTPSAYPSIVLSVSIEAYNTLSEPSGLGYIEIYDDNGANGMPGDLLYGAIVWDLSHFSLETILIDGPTITSGSFYVAVGTFFPNDNILLDDEDYGISYYHNGTAWLPHTGFTSYIGATVLQPGSNSPDFDRTNNVVGLTLNNPESGTYTLRVNGYNVPQGPQPYALVVSGEIVESLCSDNDEDTFSPEGGDCGEIDNCPFICNSDQLDADGDGIGDLCDSTPGCGGGCGQPACEDSCGGCGS